LRIPAAFDDCWVDGRRLAAGEAGLPIDDPVVQSGLGLFETLAIRDGRVLEIELHLDRLFEGVARLGLGDPSRDAVRATALEAAGEGAPSCGWLKIILTGGGRSLIFRGAMDPAEEGRSATAVILPWRRNPDDPLSGLKTLNYAGNRLGLELARRHGADEGLWLNTRGHLAEGCTSNLFVVRGGKLFTPGLREGILPGVVRGLAITAARRLGVPVHEGKLRLPRLGGATEAFLTSSLRGVRPLVAVRGRSVGTGRPGPLTGRIAAEVARVRQEPRKTAVEAPSGGGESPGLTGSVWVTTLF
jgi:branched-subunit amino acid aminotransferase/4-amino-4-deoxychorismate lyase